MYGRKYENLMDPKDTKTFWIPKIRKPVNCQRNKNLLDAKYTETFGSKRYENRISTSSTSAHEHMVLSTKPTPLLFPYYFPTPASGSLATTSTSHPHHIPATSK
jgi:hypothetical protein